MTLIRLWNERLQPLGHLEADFSDGVYEVDFDQWRALTKPDSKPHCQFPYLTVLSTDETMWAVKRVDYVTLDNDIPVGKVRVLAMEWTKYMRTRLLSDERFLELNAVAQSMMVTPPPHAHGFINGTEWKSQITVPVAADPSCPGCVDLAADMRLAYERFRSGEDFRARPGVTNDRINDGFPRP